MRSFIPLVAALACACAAKKKTASSRPPAASDVAQPAASDDGPPSELAKPGPRAKSGELPGAEEYPDAESLPEQPEEGWSVLLAGDAAPIFGVVRDKDGKPWEGVQVVLGPECGEAMLAFTNAEGRFEARGFPRCPTDVFVSVDGARAEVSVTPGEKRIDVELVPKCKPGADSCHERAAR